MKDTNSSCLIRIASKKHPSGLNQIFTHSFNGQKEVTIQFHFILTSSLWEMKIKVSSVSISSKMVCRKYDKFNNRQILWCHNVYYIGQETRQSEIFSRFFAWITRECYFVPAFSITCVVFNFFVVIRHFVLLLPISRAAEWSSEMCVIFRKNIGQLEDSKCECFRCWPF